ncbi:MAG: hypothetical protein ACXVBC_13260, partial [Bdellovibrionota bacterium]
MRSTLASLIPYERLSGLRPRTWICVGEGFVREDIKELILRRGIAFAGEAVSTLSEISYRIVAAHLTSGAQGLPHLLNVASRQEVLRAIFSEVLSDPRLRSRLVELKRLRRQGNFFQRLDAAIQQGRMAFANQDEEMVFLERLESRFGANPVREEVRALAHVYEAWLEDHHCKDQPGTLREAARLLDEKGWPASLAMPEEILYYTTVTEESRESVFWDALSRFVSVKRVDLKSAEPGMVAWDWERWHTMDDACDRLADQLAGEEKLEDQVILISDSPTIRRSLRRALDARNVRLADPRDPTRIRWDESLKWAMLPLEAVGRGFERERVIA